MRPLTATTIVLALCIACGDSTPPVGSVGTGAAVLHIKTIGDGMVRGAGSDCRGDCNFTPAAGTRANLQAIADPGGAFAGWSGACTGTNACQVTVNGEMSVTATFTRPAGTSRLTVVVEGQGRVVSSPAGIDCTSTSCSALFADGTNVSLSATSAPGAKFAGWGVGCSGPGACSVSVRGDVQVFAHFDGGPPAQVTVSATVSGPGKVTGSGMNCGDGATTCSATVVAGTPVTLTAVASPQARFTAWGGACSGNGQTCQVTPQADTAVTASFEFELQTLAANDGTNQVALALNSTKVFFARRTSDGPGIWSVPKSGGTPVRVATGTAFFIVADDGFVYWTDGFGIYSAPVEGGTGSLLATGNIGRMALDEVGALYWILIRDFQGGKGSLHRMQNRVDAVIASGQNENFGVAVDATHAYFTCSSTDGKDQAIRRVPKTGGSVETVLTTLVQPLAVRLDPQNVYFRDLNGAVWSRGKSGGALRLLSGSNGASSFVSIIELDVNASTVFWIWGDGSNRPQGLFRSQADGTAFTAVDTANDTNWFGPRVDDTAVYYFHAGALLRRLK
ncbi:MAG: InlB B-repeat-containing protein [Myxococcales bacterium]